MSEVANLVEESRTIIYAIKKHTIDGESVNRRADSGQKTVVDRDTLRDATRSSPRTSMRQHVNVRLWVWAATVRRAVAKLGAKSRGILERQLLTRLLSESSALNVTRCSLIICSGCKGEHLLR